MAISYALSCWSTRLTASERRERIHASGRHGRSARGPKPPSESSASVSVSVGGYDVGAEGSSSASTRRGGEAAATDEMHRESSEIREVEFDLRI